MTNIVNLKMFLNRFKTTSGKTLRTDWTGQQKASIPSWEALLTALLIAKQMFQKKLLVKEEFFEIANQIENLV